MHFLGDGYTVIAYLANENPLIKTREIGESLAHIWMKNILPGTPKEASLLSFQVISNISGFLYLVSLTLFTRSIFKRFSDRIIFWLGMATSGYILLFFGYAEYYSLFILSTMIFALTGFLAIKEDINKWLVLIPLLLAIFFHIMGVFLIPGAVYIIFSTGKIGKKFTRLKRKTGNILWISVVFVAIAVFYYVYTKSYFFQFAFLSLTGGIVTVEGYTLFSFNHIADFINLLFLLLPGVLLLSAILIMTPLDSIFKKKDYRFLTVLSVSTLTSAFIFDPKLGMPRDWDLFAFAGIPLTFFFYYLILDNKQKLWFYIPVSIMAILLGFLSLVPRVAIPMIPEYAVERIRDYINLDKIKNRNGQAVLTNYFKEIGDIENNQIEGKRFDQMYPQVKMLRQIRDFLNNRQFDQALDRTRKIVEIDPLYWNSRITLGNCYLHLKMYDSAIHTLEIARGMNPHSAKVYAQLGFVYFYKNEYQNAEENWVKALQIDSTQYEVILGLANLYNTLKQPEKYIFYYTKTALHDKALPHQAQQLGEYYLKGGQFDKAATMFQHALDKGLDTSIIKELLDNNPQLQPYFKPTL